MEIKVGIFPEKEQILHLYEDVGWTAYTDEPDFLMKALENSLNV